MPDDVLIVEWPLRAPHYAKFKYLGDCMISGIVGVGVFLRNDGFSTGHDKL